MEELPNYFDVIIVGTGMPECIIAAAAARIGKKVLHLDRNGYYGGDWASFSYDKFLEWMDDVKASLEPDCIPAQMLQYARFLEPNERMSLCPKKSKTIRNLVLKSYIKDSPDLPVPATGNDSENDNGDQSTENNTTEEEGSALPLSSENCG
ncbi:rab proteins geranylgeranyltransferase component A 1 [Caerostris extrusa]|uniref:Rab proteins geranylgeranyltransferase component A 1 n=1 Tax=Caerostris extrusa TaxID=172846 RepID=A0AAV4MUP6_CAEEX|nr:rab proteins geranylgeranyltransferase component A 1 [Caerostris extrusa]